MQFKMKKKPSNPTPLSPRDEEKTIVLMHELIMLNLHMIVLFNCLKELHDNEGTEGGGNSKNGDGTH